MGSPDSGSSASVLMGGKSKRSSSKPAFNESRRFCSAALCEVRRVSPSGGASAAAALAAVYQRLSFSIQVFQDPVLEELQTDFRRNPPCLMEKLAEGRIANMRLPFPVILIGV